MIELLSPAGNKDAFFAAVNSGADAVYLGLKKFSARGNAENFSEEDLIFCVNYAKLFGVKVYAAVNTLIKTANWTIFSPAWPRRFPQVWTQSSCRICF